MVVILSIVLQVADHPLLALEAFESRFAQPIGDLPSPPWLVELLDAKMNGMLGKTEELRAAVRDLLRFGGYKPTGRGKPSSEYLSREAAEKPLASINIAVDLGNAVSLHSGLPISVVDLDRLEAPLSVEVVSEGAYVFNHAGQEIRLDGLLCLHDTKGPCANAVKDSQRTKTSPTTKRTLSILWGPSSHHDHVAQAARWYRELSLRASAETRDAI